jgi:hypothetical protein
MLLDQLRSLEELRTLKAGWDSYDADPVSAEAIDHARYCLVVAEQFLGAGYNPVVGPTPDGGVALIWRKPGRGEVNAIFSRAGNIYVVIDQDRRVARKGPLDDPHTFIRDVLKPRLI